jgi:hypothetical protein
MRSIFHQILARYLATEQHAFDTAPRELWPETGYVPHAEAPESARSQPAERDHACQVYGELEPQN